MELYRESLIAEGVKFDGRLIFEGTLKLAGTFEGDIYSPDKLIVMATGIVRGNIDADEVYVAGKVEGQIKARTRIEIAEAGYVKGDIQAPILKIHEGGLFEGASSMTKLDD